MVNATFEDRHRPDFDAEANSDEFMAQIPDYIAHGVRGFTLNLQGGMPGYEGAVNSAFNADGSLRDSYIARIHRVIAACDQHGAVVILGCYYQRQDQVLKDEDAVRAGLVNVVKWIRSTGHKNIVLEIANEFGHGGFDHTILKRPAGQVELIRLAKDTSPGLLVSTSGLGDGALDESVARASDFLLIHFNSTHLEDIPRRIEALKKYGKPIVCNEDQKWREQGAKAAELCAASGVSWGLMLEKQNQHFPFTFQGAADDPVVYAALKKLSSVQPISSEPSVPGDDSLELAFRLVHEAVDRGEVPGAIALVARGGKILRQEAWGLRDIEKQLPFTTNTLCWIASITKPVTVAAAMTLVDAGKLALDDSVETYLPEFREQTDTNGVHHPFTIRQLMSHTSGLVPNPPTRRSAWPLGGPLDDSWLEKKLPDIVQTIARSQLRFKPGSKFEYSNSALFVLGRVIEIISGTPYATYVQEQILNPLGMTDTHYAPPASDANRIAVIYARRDGQRETIFRFNPAVVIANNAPDGGLFSYPAQLVPFLQMFLDNKGGVLSRRAVAEMLTPQPHGWGLGWSLSEGLFLHEGSSGTLAWADPATGAIGILFLQYRNQNKADERLRQQFRKAVCDAFSEPKRPSRSERSD
jgi:CubicO group peptidase (beta-lactamase class C family)